MTKRNILAMTSLVALSAIISTASKAEDFCRKEILGNTPAVLQSGCILEDIHITKEGMCHILAKHCLIQVLNAKTGILEDRKDLILKSTTLFKNDASLKTLKIHVEYPNLKTQLALATSSTPGKEGNYCTEEVLKKTPAVLQNKCEFFTLKKTGHNCFVVYKDCTLSVLNHHTNTMFEHKSPGQLFGEFPNDSRLEGIRASAVYNNGGDVDITYGLSVTHQ